MYGMTKPEKLFSDELTNWLIDEAELSQSKCKMSIYYKYTPYGSKLVVLSYVDECVYLYTSEEPWSWFVDTLKNMFHVKFLGYAHLFMSISISQLEDHSISAYQSRYATYVVANYLYTNTIKENKSFVRPPIFTEEDAYTID